MTKPNIRSPLAAEEETDGRRRRGNTSRARIVAAMLELVEAGNVAPGAARVAALAGVSLRTVFRHFEDMESLYREMGEAIQARVLPAFFRPYEGETWKARLLELVERRLELFEAILPFKVSGDVRRFQSAFLSRDYRTHLDLEKASLDAVLPADVAADTVLVEALRAAISFQTWRVLRKDQDLDVDEARAVMLRTLDALLAAPGAPGTRRVSRTEPGANPKHDRKERGTS